MRLIASILFVLMMLFMFAGNADAGLFRRGACGGRGLFSGHIVHRFHNHERQPVFQRVQARTACSGGTCTVR